MLTLAGWQEDLWALKLRPGQARGKRMMWLMDSDLVGLRTLADAGLGLNDCPDLFIHQADRDKAASTARPRRENFPCPHHRSKTFNISAGVGGASHIHESGGILAGDLDAVANLSRSWRGGRRGADRYLTNLTDRGQECWGGGLLDCLWQCYYIHFMMNHHFCRRELRKIRSVQVKNALVSHAKQKEHWWIPH